MALLSKTLLRLAERKKQTCFYAQFLSALATVRGNVAFNSARALINFNDGFGGGHLVERNLLFNAVRETGDHGAFNSYDRQPFFTTIRTGVASYDAAWSRITRNFILNNYHGAWCAPHRCDTLGWSWNVHSGRDFSLRGQSLRILSVSLVKPR